MIDSPCVEAPFLTVLCRFRVSIARRYWVRLLAGFLFLTGVRVDAAERLSLEVRETGGFRRSGCPTAVLLVLPADVSRETRFRLLDDTGEPVGAQFRPDGDAQATNRWWLDFGASLEPSATRTYLVEYGQGVEALAAPSGGHVLHEADDAFVVENAPYISWSVPRDLRGLLRSVDFPPNKHLRPDSPGLYLEDREGGRHPLSGEGIAVRVTRNGPLCVALNFSGHFEDGPLRGVRWTVDLTFPAPVSWVEVDCKVEDPRDKVSTVGLELHLALDAPTSEAPTLVDFGAWTYVYSSLYSGEATEMLARPRDVLPPLVRIHRGPPSELIEVASNEAVAEGWLHVMDRRRCLALAVAEFGKDADDTLVASAEGIVIGKRHWLPPVRDLAATTKKLHAWLHFVHYPPQYSAATSPRMMQTPPEVRVLDVPRE